MVTEQNRQKKSNLQMNKNDDIQRSLSSIPYHVFIGERPKKTGMYIQ